MDIKIIGNNNKTCIISSPVNSIESQLAPGLFAMAFTLGVEIDISIAVKQLKLIGYANNGFYSLTVNEYR